MRSVTKKAGVRRGVTRGGDVFVGLDDLLGVLEIASDSYHLMGDEKTARALAAVISAVREEVGGEVPATTVTG